jgi:formate dehydrogenase subunit delta
MKPASLIKMANQIGIFFDAMPNREQAVKDVATHIQKNWDPRMRAALRQHMSDNGDAELSTIVREAMSLVK